LYPQPAAGNVILELNNLQLLNTVATLVDDQGRLLRQIRLTQSRQTISLAGLKPGSYYLRLGNNESLKLIKGN
jgi:hypothetical protein